MHKKYDKNDALVLKHGMAMFKEWQKKVYPK